jgi:epoxyqueuosine reductase
MELEAGREWVGRLRGWARELGFASLGVADVDLADAQEGLARWLAAGFHGEMEYMARHGATRARPADLVPGTVRAVMVAIDYAPSDPDWVERAWATLADGERAYVSRYALGRDYHKVVRARLARLAERLQAEIGPFGWRAFCDSAPVMEVELARRAGLGWRGKHTLLLAREGGSMRFLGTLYTDLPLPSDAPVDEHCGRCTACIDACPTGAIVAPYRLDARRCISYLTIEAKGAIPVAWREAIGNRIYGCDDCQLACPWNKYAAAAALPDFAPRERLDAAGLVELFAWDREAFELGDPPDRPRTLVAQPRGRARQRDDHGRGRRGAARARARSVSAGRRARALGARAARRGAAQCTHDSQNGIATTEPSVVVVISRATYGPSPPIRAARM